MTICYIITHIRGTQYNLMYADPQRLRALVSLYFILKIKSVLYFFVLLKFINKFYIELIFLVSCKILEYLFVISSLN